MLRPSTAQSGIGSSSPWPNKPMVGTVCILGPGQRTTTQAPEIVCTSALILGLARNMQLPLEDSLRLQRQRSNDLLKERGGGGGGMQ